MGPKARQFYILVLCGLAGIAAQLYDAETRTFDLPLA